MKNEDFKTNPHRSISVTAAKVHKYDEDIYDFRLVLPIAAGFDLVAVGTNALLGNLFINTTKNQLKDLRDILNNLDLS